MNDQRCMHCGDPLSRHVGPKCLECPCGVNAPTSETLAINKFYADVQAERQNQIEKGYTFEHDEQHGVDRLLMWAEEYGRRGESLKSAALIEAARELLLARSAGLADTSPARVRVAAVIGTVEAVILQIESELAETRNTGDKLPKNYLLGMASMARQVRERVTGFFVEGVADTVKEEAQQ